MDPCLAIKCRTGYRCFEGQCRKVTGCGQKCDYSIWICAVGTSCINGKCTGPPAVVRTATSVNQVLDAIKVNAAR